MNNVKTNFSKPENIWHNISIASENEVIPTYFDDETWVGLGKQTYQYTRAASAIPENNSRIQLHGVAESTCEKYGSKYYIAVYSGGINGLGSWNDYMFDISNLIRSFDNDAYVINLENDCCDDVWYLTLGFTYPTAQIISDSDREDYDESDDLDDFDVCCDNDEDELYTLRVRDSINEVLDACKESLDMHLVNYIIKYVCPNLEEYIDYKIKQILDERESK